MRQMTMAELAAGVKPPWGTPFEIVNSDGRVIAHHSPIQPAESVDLEPDAEDELTYYDGSWLD